MAKFRERVGGWPWSMLGLHFATTVFNAYARSVLGFTAQVARITNKTNKAEEEGLRRAAPGPGVWATKEDLQHLHCYGMPRSFNSLEAVAQAAKLRMCTNENVKNGGLKLSECVERISAAGRSLTFPMRAAWWAEWRQGSLPNILSENKQEMAAKGISGQDVLQDLTAQLRGSHTEAEAERRARKKLQKAICKKIQEAESYQTHYRVRHKLERWRLPGLPRQTADRYEKHMLQVSRTAPPRVTAAVISTAWNRWCTARRFQARDSPANICQLGCGGDAEDSIEHYCRCSVITECHKAMLGIQPQWLLPLWIGTHDKCKNEDVRIRGAVGAYAAYKTTNMARHMGGITSEAAKRAFHQAVSDATAGSATLTKFFKKLHARRHEDQRSPKRPRRAQH